MQTNISFHSPSSPNSTNGAALREDPWEFLRDCESKTDGLRDALREYDLSAAVTPLEVIQTKNRDELVGMFHLLIGQTSNPFVKSTEIASQYIDSHKSLNSATISNAEIEKLLREIIILGVDSVGAATVLLTLLSVNSDLLLRMRRVLVHSLEVEENRVSWSAWKEHAGSRPETYSEVRKKKAKQDFVKFWRVSDAFLVKLIASIKET
jgi:hypothetical protein